MSWLALCDFVNPVFSRHGLHGKAANAPAAGEPPETFLKTGTFVIEARFDPSIKRAQKLLNYRRPGDAPVRFVVSVSATEGAVIEVEDGPVNQSHHLSARFRGQEDMLRLTYSWDVSKRWGLLSLENLDSGTLSQTEIPDPHPLRFDDIERMSLRPSRRPGDNAVLYFGFSAGIEPVGLSACITPHAPVETPEGPKMIDRLKPGDLVLTQDSGPQPVRWVGAREVPARGQFQPVRLRAPYFGLTRDLLVSPDQCLLITGAEVEYLFGEEQVLVQARHLVNGVSAHWEKMGPTVRLYHVLFDQHEVIRIAGCQLESLYVGAIGTDAALLQTTMLRGIAPDAMPFHSGSARPVLRNYEAMTLQSVLAG